MGTKEGFFGGFLVFGFAIFIVGFLTGMLAFIMMSPSPDADAIGFIVFIYGFVAGMIAIALLWAKVKLTQLIKKSP